MISSRGLQLSGQAISLSRRRIGVVSSRQFSSHVQYRQNRATPLLSTISSLSFKSLPRLQSNTTSHILRNGAGVRFASTTPNTVLPASTPPPTSFVEGTAASSPSPISTPLDSFSEIDLTTISSMPEQIGYLKALGFDYGYGPTAIMQWAFEHMHIYAGTPWWLSIGLTMGFIRVAMFYPAVIAAKNNAKLVAIKPELDPLNDKLRQSARDSDQMAMMDARNKINQLYKRAEISRLAMVAPLVQPVLGFGSFWILRAMAKLPVPALATEGALWFQNLTIPDPYFLLPLMTAASTHYLIKKGGENGQMAVTPLMHKGLMYGLPTLSLLFTWWLPAAVQVSFFAGAVFSLIQGLIFRTGFIRRFLGMLPLEAIKPVTAPTPYRGNMKIAATPVRTVAPPRPRALSSSELSSRFQAFQPPQNTTPFPAEQPQQQPTLQEKLKEQFSGVEQFRKDMIQKGKGKMDDRMAKASKAEKEAYEKKRAQEVKDVRIREQQRRRAERAMRKNGEL